MLSYFEHFLFFNINEQVCWVAMHVLLMGSMTWVWRQKCVIFNFSH